MKTIFNKQKRSVAGVLIALTALTTALTGCQEDFEPCLWRSRRANFP